MNINYDLLRAEASQHPYPLLFATISGAHLYGFPSADSDYDLRGSHILPAREALGLLPKRETLEVSGVRQGVELDLVTHDALKFFTMMLKRNGYVLEQVYSPLVVTARPEHAELKEIGLRCITKHHSHHYFGFAQTQWELFTKEQPRRVKPLLYVFRVLLTGIHLMRTGLVEANLLKLNDAFRLPYIDELVERKIKGKEDGVIGEAEGQTFTAEYERLTQELRKAAEKTNLPELATCRDDLNDLLIRLRVKTTSSPALKCQ